MFSVKTMFLLKLFGKLLDKLLRYYSYYGWFVLKRLFGIEAIFYQKYLVIFYFIFYTPIEF